MTMPAPRLACALALAAAAPCAHAAGGSENAARHGAVPTLQAVRAAEPIRIDGRLDDAGWHAAVPASEFRQRDPDEGKPATEKTELRVAYDDEALYVRFRLFDSPRGSCGGCRGATTPPTPTTSGSTWTRAWTTRPARNSS